MGRTRRQLARELAQELNMSETRALKVIRRLFRKLADDLVRTGRVELRGFGTFKTVKRAAQTLRNPKTGEPVHVPEYRIVSFRSAKALRKRLAPGSPETRSRRRPQGPPAARDD